MFQKNRRQLEGEKIKRFFRHPGGDDTAGGGGGAGPGTQQPAAGEQKPADQKPADQKPAAGAAAGEKPTHRVKDDGSVEILSSTAYKHIKDEAADRAKREALAELDVKAKEHGFESHAAMLAALPKLRDAEKAKADLEKKASELEQQKTATEGEKAQLAAAVTQKNREIKEREAIFRAGFIDTEYGVHLAEEHFKGLPAEQQASFDPAKFLEELKGKRPGLFATKVEIPANTGPGSAEPKPPEPGKVEKDAGENGKVDAMKMTPQEFAEYKRKNKINIHVG